MTKLSPNNPYLASGKPAKPTAPATATAKPPQGKTPKQTTKDYICSNPNCGYKGKLIVKGGIDPVLMLLFVIIAVVPGAVYAAFGGNGPVLLLGTVLGKGAMVVLIFVVCCLPFLLYAIFGGGKKTSCPNCNLPQKV